MKISIEQAAEDVIDAVLIMVGGDMAAIIEDLQAQGASDASIRESIGAYADIVVPQVMELHRDLLSRIGVIYEAMSRRPPAPPWPMPIPIRKVS